ncbi:galactose-3-O-sulfotransferase 2-like [Protopterus annectens]|uniref:galactose-3-O-sulfotransferase 2-like n=1 Tax=Protopterus annectens TaxID=7888 RepID=UPI001CFBD113|nr:galactose-3-O-sulfotransferase 2-like [Protopterus annectens]
MARRNSRANGNNNIPENTGQDKITVARVVNNKVRNGLESSSFEHVYHASNSMCRTTEADDECFYLGCSVTSSIYFFLNYQMELKTTPQCKPRTHLMFLKTHKTASSTILNILYRFGDSRNLTFALPKGKHNTFSYPDNFSSSFVEDFPPKLGLKYHIVCNHMRFNLPEVKKVIPEDSFYFSILRNPVNMMESAFTYFQDAGPFSKANSIEKFLKKPWEYFMSVASNRYYTKNFLAFDFGFLEFGNYSEEVVNYTISRIESMFDLILISEYFDESMILLKNTLCWEYEDVLSFKQNSRSNKTKHSLSEQVKLNATKWNWLDWEIYVYFNKTFWEKIDTNIGRQKMQKELKELKRKQKDLMETCILGISDPDKIHDLSLKPYQPGKARILGYALKPNLTVEMNQKCKRLVMPELQYTVILYNKQFPPVRAKDKPVKLVNSKQN